MESGVTKLRDIALTILFSAVIPSHSCSNLALPPSPRTTPMLVTLSETKVMKVDGVDRYVVERGTVMVVQGRT